jgi:hypothetical protein
MAFHVRDHAGKQAVRELARIKAKTLIEPIREAVEHEYAAISTPPPIERLRTNQPMKRSGGKPADEACFGHPPEYARCSWTPRR